MLKMLAPATVTLQVVHLEALCRTLDAAYWPMFRSYVRLPESRRAGHPFESLLVLNLMLIELLGEADVIND